MPGRDSDLQGPKGREWLVRWLPARAHDSGMFLLFSNGVGVDMNEVRTGNAMILNPYEKIIAETDSVDNDIVIADLRARELEMCTGKRWIRGRRPNLYHPLTIEGNELIPYDARSSAEKQMNSLFQQSPS